MVQKGHERAVIGDRVSDGDQQEVWVGGQMGKMSDGNAEGEKFQKVLR